MPTQIEVLPSGLTQPAVAPLPDEFATAAGVAAGMIAGTTDPLARLMSETDLIAAALAAGETAVTANTAGDVTYLPASGDTIAFSMRLERPAPGEVPTLVARPLDELHRAQEEKDRALAEAEKTLDGKQLMREQHAIIQRWLAASRTAASRVLAAAYELEKAAKPARRVTSNDVLTMEFLDGAGRVLGPADFLSELESLLGVPEQVDAVGSYIRKLAASLPGWLKPHAASVQRLLDDPRVTGSGPAARVREASRQARTARNAVRQFVARLAVRPR